MTLHRATLSGTFFVLAAFAAPTFFVVPPLVQLRVRARLDRPAHTGDNTLVVMVDSRDGKPVKGA